jgi:hypothetical protein
MSKILHKSWIKANAFGGTTFTTQCRRVSNRGHDGMNIADADAEVTCKFCRQIIDEGRSRLSIGEVA